MRGIEEMETVRVEIPFFLKKRDSLLRSLLVKVREEIGGQLEMDIR